ncbi:MAG: PDZ domain-containing protein [Firmicutes bacterium]|jgi:hypothetical protein|nr:PDZ domain-containing protein [Bacillota bacterium]
MLPVRDLTLSILRLLPLTVLDPSRAIVFWTIVFLSAVQHRRLAANEERIYGVVKNNFLEVSLSGLFYGLAGGVMASMFLVLIGVSLTGSGISYLLPLAFALYMVNPRLMCFAYAGGIVSLCHLVFGFPKVSVPGLMTLVGILHVTESVLIRLSGSGCPTPIYLRNRAGRVVGGFGLHRFWPMPLVALVMVVVPEISKVPGLIEMPDWWPLVRPAEAALSPDALFAMVPIVAALGYSDLAVTCTPAKKVRRTSTALAAYSLGLLGLAISSTFVRPLQWAAALFGPLGHEAVIALGSNRELSGEPAFVPPPRGVMILDVMPNTPASRAGLATGDVITEVSGVPVNSRSELGELVQRTPVFLEITVEDPRSGTSRTVRFRGVVHELGVITVPEEGDRPHVDVRRASPAIAMARRLVTRLTGKLGRR